MLSIVYINKQQKKNYKIELITGYLCGYLYDTQGLL